MNASASSYLEVDVSSLPQADQFAAWAAGMPAFKASTRNPIAGFEAVVRAWFIPPLVITDSKLGSVRFTRAAKQIDDDGLDSITMQLFLSGRMRGFTNHDAIAANPGEVALQDASLPISAVASPSHTTTVTLPRSLLDEVLIDADVHGRTLSGGMASLLAAFLRCLPDALVGSDPVSWTSIPGLVRDLLSTALLGESCIERPGSEAPLRNRARRYIARNIAAELNVSMIASAIGVSRAALYRAFEPHGGVMAYVQEQRLTRLRRALADPADIRPLGTLASLHGFKTASEMGRAFRRRFDLTPGAVRARLVPTANTAGSVQRRFRGWVEEELEGGN